VCCRKTVEPIKMLFGMWTWVGPRKHVLDGGTHWRHLANTIEPSLCSGDAALCQICKITLTDCLNNKCVCFSWYCWLPLLSQHMWKIHRLVIC